MNNEDRKFFTKLETASFKGDLRTVKQCVSERLVVYPYQTEWALVLAHAYVGNHANIIKILKNHGAPHSPDECFVLLCQTNSSEIPNKRELISQWSSNCFQNGIDTFDRALQGLLQCEPIEIDLVDMIANHPRYSSGINWNRALLIACGKNSLKLVEFCIHRGDKSSLNNALDVSSECGNLSIVRRLMQAGASNFETVLMTASKKGHLDLVEFVLNECFNYQDNETSLKRHLNCALWFACQNQHLVIAEILINHGADDLRSSLRYACRAYHIHVVEWICTTISSRSHLKHNFMISWNDYMGDACFSGSLEVVKLIVDAGATNWNVGLRQACKAYCRRHIRLEYPDIGVIALMIANGATNLELLKHLDDKDVQTLIEDYTLPVSKFHDHGTVRTQLVAKSKIIRSLLNCFVLSDLSLIVSQYLVRWR